jgi:ferredoxin
MPKVLAQGKTIECDGVVSPLGHTCFKQVFIRLTFSLHLKARRIKAYTDDIGANLRKILQQNGIDLYNSGAKVINCHIIGSCATCAVKVESKVSAVNWRGKARQWSVVKPQNLINTIASFSFSYSRPAFSLPNSGLGNVKVTKFDGFSG